MASARASTPFIRSISCCWRGGQAILRARLDFLFLAQQLGQAHARVVLDLAGAARRRVLADGVGDLLANLVVAVAQAVDGGAQILDRLLDVLGPDLLLGARAAVVLLDGDQLRLQRLDLDVQLRCAPVELAVLLLDLGLARLDRVLAGGQVLELALEPVALDGDVVQGLALLGRQRRLEDRAHLADELLAHVDQLVLDLDRLRARRRQVGEDPGAAVALHGALDSLDQLLARLQIALQIADVATPG